VEQNYRCDASSKARNRNLDAEPVMPCEAARSAVVVYGQQFGRKPSVCTDRRCPVHDPQAAAEAAAHPVPKMPPPQRAETGEEAAERLAEFERLQAEFEEERQRREEERKHQFEKQQAEMEAERNSQSRNPESPPNHLRAHP